MWDISEDEEEWFKNPGGIPGNVLSKLPRVLIIPAETSSSELCDSKKGTLAKTLGELFEDVRDVVVEQLNVSPDEVKEESKFVEDLGADSLDVVELVMALEEEFDIEIPDDKAEGISTVSDAIKFIEENK